MYYFIESMVEADIDRVREIERRSFSTPWSASTYRSELRHQSTSRYIVVRASTVPPPPRTSRGAGWRGGLLGLFPSFFRMPEQDPADLYPVIGYGGVWLSVDEGHITTIAVMPEYRRRGIGELLLNGLIDQAYDLHADMLTLEVRVGNHSAQQLYVKYGFRPAGTRPRYYTDNGEDALIMWTDPIRDAAFQERLQILRARLYERFRGMANDPPPAVGDTATLV